MPEMPAPTISTSKCSDACAADAKVLRAASTFIGLSFDSGLGPGFGTLGLGLWVWAFAQAGLDDPVRSTHLGATHTIKQRLIFAASCLGMIFSENRLTLFRIMPRFQSEKPHCRAVCKIQSR